MPSSADLTFIGFVRQVLDALHAADLTYLIGGAVALWAWGEPRTTADLDLVRAYIDGWVQTLNLAGEWRTIQERIAEL